MKIPEQAKLVFKGEIFEIFQWEQTLFDNSNAIFEMIKRADTAEVIAISDGKIWYAEQEQPAKGVYHSFFGGRIEPGESAEIGAARELKEEAGMTGTLELIQAIMPLNKMEWTNYIFVAKNCTITHSQNPDPGEKIRIKSCTFEELIQKIMNQEIKTSPQFIISIFDMVYRQPQKLTEFKKKLGLV